jgi:hypothetical protein
MGRRMLERRSLNFNFRHNLRGDRRASPITRTAARREAQR